MNLGERFGGLGGRSAVLIGLTIGAGLLHHIDHVLRVDHSGWPFRPEVNPFTFSLLAYLILLFALFGPRRLFWLRWVLLLLGVAFTIFAHTVLETPGMQVHDVGSQPQQRPTGPRLAQFAWGPVPSLGDGSRHRFDDAQRPTGNQLPVDALGWPEDESPARRDIKYRCI